MREAPVNLLQFQNETAGGNRFIHSYPVQEKMVPLFSHQDEMLPLLCHIFCNHQWLCLFQSYPPKSLLDQDNNLELFRKQYFGSSKKQLHLFLRSPGDVVHVLFTWAFCVFSTNVKKDDFHATQTSLVGCSGIKPH